MKSKRAYTLVEILVAAGILAMFMLSAFMIFRQLTMTYRVSEWKASRQKELQIFLQTLKEDLEKANSAYVIQASGEASRIDPEINVFVNSLAFNNDESGTDELKSNGNNQPVVYFAIVKPGVEFSEFSNQTSGSWQGCSLVLTGRALNYQRTGDLNRHTNTPIPIPGIVSTVPGSGVTAGGLFEPNLSNNFSKRIEDVAGISFFLIENGEKRALKVVVNCQLQKSGLPESIVSESTIAKLMKDTKVTSPSM